jgi:predicted negative regulator of RcsB-dependent stress response
MNAASSATSSGDPALVARSKGSRLKRFFWTLLVFVLGVGGAYGAGYFQMQAKVDAATAQVSAAQNDLQAAQRKEAAERQQVTELEARRRIHLAIMEFDQNNFGTAEEHLRAAAAELDSVRSAGDTALAGLAASLRKVQLAPSLDLTAQHTALLDLAKAFDKARPPPPAPK